MKTTDYIEQLVTMRCLSLFFYNFTRDQINTLRKVQEFDHVWGELEAKAKKKKWFSIPDTELYAIFVSVSYETQAEIIRVAFEKYETEARDGITEAQTFKALMHKHIKNLTNEKI